MGSFDWILGILWEIFEEMWLSFEKSAKKRPEYCMLILLDDK